MDKFKRKLYRFAASVIFSALSKLIRGGHGRLYDVKIADRREDGHIFLMLAVEIGPEEVARMTGSEREALRLALKWILGITGNNRFRKV